MHIANTMFNYILKLRYPSGGLNNKVMEVKVTVEENYCITFVDDESDL